MDSTNYYAAKLEELNSSIEDKHKKQRDMAEARESNESSSGVSEWIAHAISVTSGAALNSLVGLAIHHRWFDPFVLEIHSYTFSQ